MRLPALFLALITTGDVTAFAPFAFHRSRRVFALRSTVSAASPEKVIVLEDADAVSKAVQARVEAAAQAAIAVRGHFALAIPGGSILKMLAGTKPSWSSKCTIVYVNHKCVPMDDAHLATHAKAGALFLDAWAGVDVVTMTGSGDSTMEATKYTEAIDARIEAGKIPTTEIDGMTWPKFDLSLIGVGDDGHVGSLYPDRDEVTVKDRWVLPVDMKTPGSITLSLPVMATSSEIVIAACGVSDKYPQGKSAGMVRAIEGAETLSSFPACGLRETATWIIDKAAASKLSSQYQP